MNRTVPQSLPSLLTPRTVFLAPWSGMAYMVMLILIEVRFGGWPSASLDAIAFLVIFNLATAVFTPFILRENDDWKEDRAHERHWLGRLMSFHAWATLAVTLLGSAVLAAAISVSIVLAGIVFLSGVLTMTVMLLGRR